MPEPESGVKLSPHEVNIEVVASEISLAIADDRQSQQTDRFLAAMAAGAKNKRLKSLLDVQIQANLELSRASRDQIRWEYKAKRLQILQLIETRINDVRPNSQQ